MSGPAQTRPTPLPTSTRWVPPAPLDVSPPLVAPIASAATTVASTVTASTHPNRNERRFAPAWRERSTTVTAMIGVGRIASPIANGGAAPMAWPMAPLAPASGSAAVSEPGRPPGTCPAGRPGAARTLGSDPMERGSVRAERGSKRVRAFLGGELVAETTRPLLVWEVPYFPTYYFDEADVTAELVATGTSHHSPSRGDAEVMTVRTPGGEAPEAARRYPTSPLEALAGTVRLDWQAMDAWFEEDEEVYVHPRDPHTRIDVLRSSRHVVVEIDGVVVADSARPVLLFETGLPVRYYLDKTDVRMDLCTPTATTSQCPYKGTAEYYSVTVGGVRHDDVVWWYRHPARESIGIAGLVCFYNERVDLVVDGERLERPSTKFS